ncbi:NIPSNAP family protein [Bradyrhizobium sp.]|uniref:NIPSNAP family protein n=1 Tax=Bradyrhizobium sp. TaxID=376 RepID=UPI0026151FD9|nr:NIPSNAP family protein [Bradyrhizobium sp.]
MILELRVYRCVPGRLPALLKRFENTTLKLWEKTRHQARRLFHHANPRIQSGTDLHAALGLAG